MRQFCAFTDVLRQCEVFSFGGISEWKNCLSPNSVFKTWRSMTKYPARAYPSCWIYFWYSYVTRCTGFAISSPTLWPPSCGDYKIVMLMQWMEGALNPDQLFGDKAPWIQLLCLVGFWWWSWNQSNATFIIRCPFLKGSMNVSSFFEYLELS